MKPYSKFRPTAFDSHISLDDEDENRENWLVVPCSRTRDSGLIDKTNFDAALDRLGGEGDNVEVHRFRHWGPGWFEIIIVRPDTDAAEEGEAIENALSNYPLLDESGYSNAACEAEWTDWNDYGRADFKLELYREHKFNALDWPAEALDELWYSLREVKGYADTEYHDADGTCFYVDRNAALVTRTMVAKALLAARKSKRAKVAA